MERTIPTSPAMDVSKNEATPKRGIKNWFKNQEITQKSGDLSIIENNEPELPHPAVAPQAENGDHMTQLKRMKMIKAQIQLEENKEKAEKGTISEALEQVIGGSRPKDAVTSGKNGVTIPGKQIKEFRMT